MQIILLFSIPFILLISLYFFLHSPTTKNPKNGGFKPYPLLGSLPEFLSNRRRYLDWLTDVLSSHRTHTSVFFRPGKVSVITADPENIEHILKTRFSNYPKGLVFISHLSDFLGAGIFCSDADQWKLHRKTAIFEFNKRSLKNFVLNTVRSEISTRLVPLLDRASGSDRVLDLQDVFERFTFDNVCELAFNVDPGALSRDGESTQSEFMRAFEDAATLSAGRFMYALPVLWKVKRFFNIGSERRLRESIRTVHDFADKIIRMRLEEKSEEKYQDLLSRFIISTEENLNLPRDRKYYLRDVVISFILAGRDTTSSGLSWFFWLLSLNPDVLEKIRSEVGEVRARAGKQIGETFDFEELREMNYLHAAISESLRLYPPVPVDTKACLDDDVLPDGTKVKRDWFVTYNTYVMGRMESIWGKDYLEYRPERWLDENGLYKPESSFRFPVFHAGPRICLGKEMAYIQIKSITACVVEQFELDVLSKDTRPEFLLSLTLRMKGGLPVKVKARS